MRTPFLTKPQRGHGQVSTVRIFSFITTLRLLVFKILNVTSMTRTLCHNLIQFTCVQASPALNSIENAYHVSSLAVSQASRVTMSDVTNLPAEVTLLTSQRPPTPAEFCQWSILTFSCKFLHNK